MRGSEAVNATSTTDASVVDAPAAASGLTAATAGPLPALMGESVDEKRRLARLLLTIVLAGTVLGIVYHVVLHYGFGWQYPWSTYLFRPAARFSDFLTDWVTVRSYGAPAPLAPTQMDGYYYAVPQPYVLAYSPLAHLFMRGLAVLPPIWGLALEIAAMFITVVYAGFLCMRHAFTSAWAQWLAAVVLACTAYPVVFAADRGNLDMLMFVIVFWGLMLYARGSLGWAMALIGFAAAMKYYPVILLALPVIDRRYKAAVWGAAVAVVTTLGAAGIIGFMTPGISPFGVLRYAWRTLSGVHGGYATWGFEGINYRHGIWGVIHLLWIRVFGADPSGKVVLLYMALAAIAGIAIFIWLYRASGRDGRGVPLWRKAGILVVLMILLPPIAADYTLLYVFIPLALAFMAPGISSARKATVVLLALCLIPMDYLVIEPFFKGDAYASPTIGDTKSSVIAYALFLTGAVIAMLVGARETADDERRDPRHVSVPASG
jgi:hypothetical protein